MKIVWPQSPGNGHEPGGHPRRLASHAPMLHENESSGMSDFGVESANALLRIAHGLAFEADVDGRILAVSDMTSSLLDYPKEFLLSQTLFELVDSDDAAAVRTWLSECVDAGHPPLTVRLVRGLRDTVRVQLSASPRHVSRQHSGYVIWGQDVSELWESRERMHRLAAHDPLTGLGNRLMLKETIAKSIESGLLQGTEFAVALLDLDGFKRVNDSLGHSVGDELLIAAAQRLKATVRDVDIVTRMGGDEFLIILSKPVTTASIDRIVSRILTAIERPFLIGGRSLRVTTSIGVSMFPEHGTTEAALLQRADLAMYQAKSDGKNQFQMFTETLLTRQTWLLSLESSMFDGMRDGEFYLHYQPICNAATGEVWAVEALMRWTHAGQLVPPSEFIPLAEETDTINLLGEWALRGACMQLTRWDEEGIHLDYMSVNISPRQFMFSSFPRAVRQALKDADIAGERLMLEITESILARDPGHAAQVLQELRLLGVRFAVDDFGTGYSSLAYLKTFPLSVLKIDRSFISDMPESRSDQAIVSAVLGLARELGLSTTAEGVETETHRAMLAEKGCTAIQGFLISPALAPTEFERQIKSGTLRLSQPVEIDPSNERQKDL